MVMEFFLLFFLVTLILLLVAVIRAQKKKLSPLAIAQLEDQWEALLLEHDPRNQILNADILVDMTMKAAGYQGRSLGERLKTYPQAFSDINGLWWAHKLRNTLAHELSYGLNDKEVHKAMKKFAKALNDLGLDVQY